VLKHWLGNQGKNTRLAYWGLLQSSKNIEHSWILYVSINSQNLFPQCLFFEEMWDLWHWWISWVGRFHIGIFSHCRVTWISIAFWELYLFIVNGSRASPFPRLSRPTGDVTSASRVPCRSRPWYDYNNIFQILIAPETFLFLFLEKSMNIRSKRVLGVEKCVLETLNSGAEPP
jgi:hypothetical protein